MLGLTVLLAIGIGWLRFYRAAAGQPGGLDPWRRFALINQDGKPVTEPDFAGPYRLMYFGYTFCPDVCPTDVGYFARPRRL